MLAFELPQRGVFRFKNGSILKPISIQNLSKSVQGAKPKHIQELIGYGVIKVARKDGALYSKRLVRDELHRRHKAQAGAKGGKQTASKPQARPQAKRGSSSSSSSSSSDVFKKQHSQNRDFDPTQFQAVWNKYISHPQCRVITEGRKTKLRARVKSSEHFADIAKFEALVKRISETPFLLGKNDRGWRASFDWLVANDDNAVKVVEGRYDQPKDPSAFDIVLAELHNAET